MEAKVTVLDMKAIFGVKEYRATGRADLWVHYKINFNDGRTEYVSERFENDSGYITMEEVEEILQEKINQELIDSAV